MKWWTSLGIDLVWVLIFAVIGRLSHAEGLDPLGVARTAWPFAVALTGVTVALNGIGRSPSSVLDGVWVWAGTLAFGMWIRSNIGDGVQFSFVIVAGIFLVVGMLGWRLVAARRTRAA